MSSLIEGVDIAEGAGKDEKVSADKEKEVAENSNNSIPDLDMKGQDDVPRLVFRGCFWKMSKR